MINKEMTKIAIEYLTELRDSRQDVLPNEAPYYEAEKDMDMFNLAIEALEMIDDVSPCANCQEWDCYGCKVKESNNE